MRSSAEGEDAHGASQAGQFHTAFVSTFDELLAALDAVIDSARGARMQSAPALNGNLPEVAPGPLDAPRCDLVLEGPDEAAMGCSVIRR